MKHEKPDFIGEDGHTKLESYADLKYFCKKLLTYDDVSGKVLNMTLRLSGIERCKDCGVKR